MGITIMVGISSKESLLSVLNDQASRCSLATEGTRLLLLGNLCVLASGEVCSPMQLRPRGFGAHLKQNVVGNRIPWDCFLIC